MEQIVYELGLPRGSKDTDDSDLTAPSKGLGSATVGGDAGSAPVSKEAM